MTHIALYRAWRPQTFQEIAGQQHITRTLQNSLAEGRLSHAYLFSGPRGTGKTSAAKILAKAVNCENGPAAEPCNRCSACERITAGAAFDVLEIDAASNRGVEEIRDIRDKVKFAPTELRKKVYIIDEVHMLTTEAFNALLKTLEEPPSHVMFILATTEPHRLPATIISRCQRFDFRRVPIEEQVDRLALICRQENIEAEPEALRYLARLSEGGMRDALSLLDQAASYSGDRLTYRDAVAITGGIASEQFGALAKAIKDRDAGKALELIDGLMQEGKSADRCMEHLLLYFRDLLVKRLAPAFAEQSARFPDPSGEMAAAAFDTGELFRMIEVLNRYQSEMKYSAQPQTILEVAVLKLCAAEEAADPASASPAAAGAGLAAAAAAPAPATADSELKEEVHRLRERIARLEEQLAKLAEAPAPGPGSSRTAARPAGRPAPPAGRIRKIRLDGFVRDQDSPHSRQALAKWHQVLAGVKERKITVHAWLVDGEPVALSEDSLLVVFKSSMHRETTERPANKTLIEQVMASVYGHPFKLATAMKTEWEEAQAGARTPEPPQAERAAQERSEDDVVDAAIKLFGEKLVDIKD